MTKSEARERGWSQDLRGLCQLDVVSATSESELQGAAQRSLSVQDSTKALIGPELQSPPVGRKGKFRPGAKVSAQQNENAVSKYLLFLVLDIKGLQWMVASTGNLINLASRILHAAA